VAAVTQYNEVSPSGDTIILDTSAIDNTENHVIYRILTYLLTYYMTTYTKKVLYWSALVGLSVVELLKNGRIFIFSETLMNSMLG